MYINFNYENKIVLGEINMKKIMSLLIVVIIVGVVAVSGCISLNDKSDVNPLEKINPTTKDMINDSAVNNTIKNNTATNQKNVTANSAKNETKVYSSDEAGAYVEMEYDGVKVNVRENYPYYSPQSGKIYYSAQEEAKELAQLAKDMKDNTTNNKTNDTKVYSSDEAGAYIETEYNGVKVYVRENYPYYSPQTGKIYYSAQQEAKELAQLAADMN